MDPMDRIFLWTMAFIAASQLGIGLAFLWRMHHALGYCP